MRALLRAPADLGWQPATMRSGQLPLGPRTLALAGMALCLLSVWVAQRQKH